MHAEALDICVLCGLRELRDPMVGPLRDSRPKTSQLAGIPHREALLLIPDSNELRREAESGLRFWEPRGREFIMAEKLAHSLEVAESLKKMDIFRDMTELDLFEVAAGALLRRFDTGDTLMTEGTPGGTAFVILSGEVAITLEGKELTRRGAGDCLGELALIDSGTRSATVVARSSVKAVSVSRNEFLKLLDRRSFVQSLLTAMASKLRQTVQARADDAKAQEALEDAFAEYVLSKES